MNQPVDRATAQRIHCHLQDRRDEMVERLAAWVRLETPSVDPATQGPLFARLGHDLEALGFRVRCLSGRATGGQLYARPARRQRGQLAQLLLGHSDTVWPVGTLAEMPVRVTNGRLYGPGSYDMKGGLVQMLFALRALHEMALEPVVLPLIFINSDEEIGSRESTAHIARLARVVERVWVLEPSLGPAGRLKTARKGVGRFTVTVHGRAAHAGLNPEEGTSAILELAHVIQSLFALNDPARGVTVNVGQIDGGLRPNVVAPQSQAHVDVRVPTLAEARAIEQAIHGLRPVTPGVRISVQGRVDSPPMERTPRNQALWRVARRVGAQLGLSLEEGMAGGGSDGNTTSLYTATLDGLGAVGTGAHALDESVLVEKLVERAALLACLLLVPSQPGEAALVGREAPAYEKEEA